jgi:hypothetical protein
MLVIATDGQAVDGASGDLGFRATDACVGIEGTCEVPAAPLVGVDGTTFMVGAYFNNTTVAGLSPSGQMLAGWPYQSDAGHQGVGVCTLGDICEGYDLASSAIGPDNVLFLIHAAKNSSAGGSIVAIGPDGRIVNGWPVELKRSGSEFWSIVAAPNGSSYALAIEPEPNGSHSATILKIAPDSTVQYTVTIVEP